MFNGGSHMTINEYCKKFRIETLKLSMEEFARRTSKSSRTLTSFERHQSTNMNHIQTYLNATPKELEEDFFKGLANLMVENKNGN